MNQEIILRGVRAETLLGFLTGLGTLRLLEKRQPGTQLSWEPSGGGWAAMLHVPPGTLADAEAVAGAVFEEVQKVKTNHPILDWERFVSKTYASERAFLDASASAFLDSSACDAAFTPLFTSQRPAQQNDALEHFDSPFRAARRDYFPDNLRSVIANTDLTHLIRTLTVPWDYADAMANQSLRLDHGDDRRHAYQWYAPTADPARGKIGCMLGANRLALEAFPLFPCIPSSEGNTAVGFTCESKTWTWVSWPVWEVPCSTSVISSLLNLTAIHEAEPDVVSLRHLGLVAVFRSRRLPVEKNKVFLPPVAFGA